VRHNDQPYFVPWSAGAGKGTQAERLQPIASCFTSPRRRSCCGPEVKAGSTAGQEAEAVNGPGRSWSADALVLAIVSPPTGKAHNRRGGCLVAFPAKTSPRPEALNSVLLENSQQPIGIGLLLEARWMTS